MDQPFRFRHAVVVRFKDIDVGGHAHHSHALVYFEEARAAWWAEVSGQTGLDGVDYILAECTIRWHARVLWPKTLDVGVRCTKLGKRHFHLTYEVRDADEPEGDLLISGGTVQVSYDYSAGRAAPLDPGTRAAIEELDGPFGPGGVPLPEET